MGKLSRGAVVVALACAFTGTASAAVVRRHTASGDALARAELLRRTDLGAGWQTISAAPRRTPELTCGSFSPHVGGVVERGAASSATFALDSGGPFVAQASYVYASAAQERALWSRLARLGLGRCLKQSLVRGSGHGITFTATGVKEFSAPKLGVMTRAFRVSGMAATTDQSLPVYLDVVLLGAGRSISALSLSSFDVPPARSLELRLGRKIAPRLSAG